MFDLRVSWFIRFFSLLDIFSLLIFLYLHKLIIVHFHA